MVSLKLISEDYNHSKSQNERRIKAFSLLLTGMLLAFYLIATTIAK